MNDEELLKHSTIEAMAERDTQQNIEDVIIRAADPKMEVTRRDRAAHAALIGSGWLDATSTADVTMPTMTDLKSLAAMCYVLADKMEESR